MTTTTATPARELFTFLRTGKHENCCECCEGYCPQEGDQCQPGLLDLYRLTIRGTDYLSDRYVAVLADRVQLDPADENVHVEDVRNAKPEQFPIPTTVPGESEEIFNPGTIHGIIAAGYIIRQGEPRLEWTGEKLPYPPGVGRPQHIYDGCEHIGWVMPVSRDEGITCRLSDVSRIAAYADEASVGGWQIPVMDNADPWIIAAAILREAKRIQEVHA